MKKSSRLFLRVNGCGTLSRALVGLPSRLCHRRSAYVCGAPIQRVCTCHLPCTSRTADSLKGTPRVSLPTACRNVYYCSGRGRSGCSVLLLLWHALHRICRLSASDSRGGNRASLVCMAKELHLASGKQKAPAEMILRRLLIQLLILILYSALRQTLPHNSLIFIQTACSEDGSGHLSEAAQHGFH